jgi:hypothetical protein
VKPSDPDFCEAHCPLCATARKGKRLAVVLQRIEMAVTFGGCPSGRVQSGNTACSPTSRFHLQARKGLIRVPSESDFSSLQFWGFGV